MRLLVTGGAGYIGGFTTRRLLRLGHDVTVVDDLSSGTQTAAGGATLVQGDIGDEATMRSVLASHRIEAVLHLAGLKSVAESWHQPDRYHKVNVEGTRALARAMADSGVRLMVFSSSCAIYGDAAALPVGEGMPPYPMNPYAESKWNAEQALADIARTGGLRHVALRYFNAAGAELDGSAGELLAGAQNVIPMVMKAALGHVGEFTINGTDYPTPDGTAVRDYVHVLDLAEVHVRALDYLCAGGAPVAVNVGTGVGTSVREILSAAERAIGRKIPVVEAGRRPGDPAAAWANVELADRLLRWRARYGHREIIDSAWAWHSSHPRAHE